MASWRLVRLADGGATALAVPTMLATRARPGFSHEVRFAGIASGARIAWARCGRAGAATLLRVAHWR